MGRISASTSVRGAREDAAGRGQSMLTEKQANAEGATASVSSAARLSRAARRGVFPGAAWNGQRRSLERAPEPGVPASPARGCSRSQRGRRRQCSLLQVRRPMRGRRRHDSPACARGAGAGDCGPAKLATTSGCAHGQGRAWSELRRGHRQCARLIQAGSDPQAPLTLARNAA